MRTLTDHRRQIAQAIAGGGIAESRPLLVEVNRLAAQLPARFEVVFQNCATVEISVVVIGLVEDGGGLKGTHAAGGDVPVDQPSRPPSLSQEAA